jgi:hypothetical protein
MKTFLHQDGTGERSCPRLFRAMILSLKPNIASETTRHYHLPTEKGLTAAMEAQQVGYECLDVS